MIKKVNVLIFFLLFGYSMCAQMDQYNYKNKLNDVKDNWHSIQIPDEVFGKVNSNVSDIRIYGITTEKDTVEAPYLLKLNTEKISLQKVPFTILNTSYNQKGLYTTLEVTGDDPVNEIELKYEQPNFDWRITLEGSQDQKEWFTIKEGYRILSIKNDITDYQFTTIRFPKAQYRYFRIFIKDAQKANLKSATMVMKTEDKAGYQEYKIVKQTIGQSKKHKTTTVDVTFTQPLSISYLKIKADNTFDYYRPVSIQYAADSIKTSKGAWKLRYVELDSGILSSIEENIFTFKSTITKKIRIVIDNHDNQPLSFKTIEAKGYKHELVTRFTSPATYYLVYGNKNARHPSYDLGYVSSKIPDTIQTLSLNKEEPIMNKHENDNEITSPLFENKIWLWGIMGLIILVLGGFTLSMMKKK